MESTSEMYSGFLGFLPAFSLGKSLGKLLTFLHWFTYPVVEWEQLTIAPADYDWFLALYTLNSNPRC